jgi:hypothetical protein|tara:strand:+ start:431 stop:649 length:219 start_codon:yes stop_codon:yes gene_type:complete
MKKIIFSLVFLIFSFNTQSIAKEIKCSEISKFSPKYLACKAKSITGKTISKSKNFINKTKEYQKKAWAKENR